MARHVGSPSSSIIFHHAFGSLELEWGERKILLGWLELELLFAAFFGVTFFTAVM